MAKARKQEEACKTDIAAAKEDLEKADPRARPGGRLSQGDRGETGGSAGGIAKLIENNQAMAGRIAQQQLEAAQRIDQRTRAMAQSGTRGGNSGVGIYDRDYYRQAAARLLFPYAPHTVVGWIIAINVAVWLVDDSSAGRPPEARPDHRPLAQRPTGGSRRHAHPPWLWWQFLTAGFAHSPAIRAYPVGNMLVLFFLGRDVEECYGAKEFLRLYLVTVVFANVVWSVANKIAGTPTGAGDLRGLRRDCRRRGPVRLELPPRHDPAILRHTHACVAVRRAGGRLRHLWRNGRAARASNVAYAAHLAGAAFAFVYYWQGWNLTRLTAGRFAWPAFRWPGFRRKPRLRVHQPDEPTPSNLSAEVDRILEKIYREGEASLTAEERKFLETASREYQRRTKAAGGRRKAKD